MAKLYWNFEYDGVEHDIECATKDEAIQWANDWFGEKCIEDESPENGEAFKGCGTLIEYNYDVEGDAEKTQSVMCPLEYEHYHGDEAEHFCQGDFI
jgi:hypothetical protein